MRSVVDRNVVMRLISVAGFHKGTFQVTEVQRNTFGNSYADKSMSACSLRVVEVNIFVASFTIQYTI